MSMHRRNPQPEMALERCRAENEQLRKLIYRMTAPTASVVEEDDRQAAFNEGRELTRP